MMNNSLGFVEAGVRYHIFATKNEVTVIAISKTFTINVNGKTIKEAISNSKKVIREHGLSTLN
ncbi:hypothetical protein KHA94_24335 [Bacillus sp. FJAT-49705]|uniref:Uncharacterized protein n=1 Tax=Cytobacillus citreus TaxID=2833586 RepID=A0ABS5NZF0_9BACI|nr:hypothetical protein [Cytobacillus citreus]MBS4193224.1 hypothetical protein [Cytobacillus citreus]